MKKKIPLALLRSIQPLIEKNKHLITVHRDPKYMFWIVDTDPDSDFYFKVRDGEEDGKFILEYKPYGEYSVSDNEVKANIENVVKQFASWTTVLDKYASLQTIYDDPVIKAYEKEFYQALEISEVDAEYVGFSYHQLLILDEYFGDATATLIGLSAQANSPKKEAIQSLIEDVTELQEETPTMPKSEVIKRLVKVFGKASKLGLSVLKALYGKFKEKIIDKISEVGVDTIAHKANDLLDAASELL